MTIYKYIAPCHFGLESVLSGELKRMGANDVTSTNGRVTFTGDASMMARANINLRTAERVLIELATFKATSFEQLFDGTATIPIDDYLASKDAFPVKGWSLNSKLYSIPDCQSIIKKALVERMKKAYSLEWLPETGVTHQIQFSIHNDEVCIMLDTSGAGLHKRGYRSKSNIAPIKETLAAGILDLARMRDNSVFYDPFCGSGTFLIEAATKALNIPPCLKRKFASQNYHICEQSVWQQERERGIAMIKKDATFRGYGSDIDTEAITLSRENAMKAGVLSRLSISSGSINDFVINDVTIPSIICCNPPYGERMLEEEEANKIYDTMGRVFGQVDNSSIYVISPSETFEKTYGTPAKKRRKLYNGMIKCQLFMYFPDR